jgi:hypothetical protein
MTNDEIFFLCVLTGAKEILGIKNPIDKFSLEIAKEKWQRVSEGLNQKGIIYNNDEGRICICDEYLKISTALSFPDVAFDCSLVGGESSYIFIKGSIYVHLVRREECDLRLFNNRGELIEFLSKEFMFSFCESVVSIVISVDDMDKALELFINGKMQQAIAIISEKGFNSEDVQLALTVFTGNDASRDFIGYRQNQETPSDALFKSIKTEDGTWLFKIWNDNVKMIRCNPDEALSEVLNF